MRTFRLGYHALMAVGLLLSGCPKGKSPPPAAAGPVQDAVDAQHDAAPVDRSDTLVETSPAIDTGSTSLPDVILGDTGSVDDSGAADLAVPDTFQPDVPPDVPKPDGDLVPDGEVDGKVIAYLPADPCSEEPVAPQEGTACGVVDELRCSDHEQGTEKSFSWQTTKGSEWVQVCKRLFALRCEVAAKGGHAWVRHLAADLVGPDVAAAGSKVVGIWCLSTPEGVAIEPGSCDGTKGSQKACPKSMWGKRGCAGTTAIRSCGTAEVIQSMIPTPQKSWHYTPAKHLGSNLLNCDSFARRYDPENCTNQNVYCKYPLPEGGTGSAGVNGACIPDNDTGAHCATTCAELGLENP